MSRRRKKALSRSPDFEVRSKAVPEALFPEGRVRFSLGTTDRAEADARRAELRKLVLWRAWDVLAAVQDGALDVGNVSAKVKSEGEAALVALRAKAEAEKAGRVPTLREMAEKYMTQYEEGGRREEHSIKQVRSRLLGPRRGFCKHKVEHEGVTVEIGALPFPVVEHRPDLIEQVIQRHWSNNSTREAIRGAVSGMFSWAVEAEARDAKIGGRSRRWSENPAASVEQYERRPRIVTAAESQVVALLRHAESYQEAYLRAFLHLGLRQDELIHTRLHLDLDTETWIWRVQGRGPDERHSCIQCRGSGWTPKTTRSTRDLLVPDRPARLRASILGYLEMYPCEPGDFVFRNPRRDAPWEAGVLLDDFNRLCQRAGVTYGRDVAGGIVLHDLRATCATRLVQAKERESVIAALLGDTVATIVKTYVRLRPEDTARAVANGPSYSTEDVVQPKREGE